MDEMDRPGGHSGLHVSRRVLQDGYRFLRQKQGIDTFDALRRIAQRLHISLFEIGYAGLKDKHALARQYISIPTRYNVQGLKIDSLLLTPVGYSQKKIKIGDLEGNRFIIVARDIQEKELSNIL